VVEQLIIREMARDEVDELVRWAAREGWNPGMHDADIFWATDSDAFIAAECQGKLIGGGAITSYGGHYGFMGFFIVKPEYRGQGFGNRLWHERRDRLIGRLHKGAIIGMDGVFDMQAYYAKGGFKFSHRNMRFEAHVARNHPPPLKHPAVVPLDEIRFDTVKQYDRRCFPARREVFLQHWLNQQDSLALGFEDGGFRGYGVIRRCVQGCKIGPLFTDSGGVARVLFDHLLPFAAGGPVYLDAPENNPEAMALVRHHGMREVFGCARMYLGPIPDIDHSLVFGVTSFELG
jgi:GNAT superfamily N-acetyltransferase